MFTVKIGALAGAVGYFQVGLNGQPNADHPFSRLVALKLPGHLSVKIAILTKAVEEKMSAFQAAHRELIEKHGTKQEDGNFQVDPEKIKEFTEELNDALNAEIELPGDKLKAEQIAFAQISPQDMLALQWLFSDFDTEEKPAASEPKKKKLAAVK